MIEWIVQAELILKQMHQKNVMFVINGILKTLVLNMSYDLMQKAINFTAVAIVSVEGSDNRIRFWYMS